MTDVTKVELIVNEIEQVPESFLEETLMTHGDTHEHENVARMP